MQQLDLKKGSNWVIGHLIAELSFGFWTALLDKRYEQQLWPKIIKASFPGMLNSERTIAKLRHRFHFIRKFRNRIFHYEAIWHWQNLPQVHTEIIEAISWIEPCLLDLIKLDRFVATYQHNFR
jgi:hypothetical protein